MVLELERTFLLKELPKGLKDCKSEEFFDIYIPRSVPHPILRIRKRGDVLEITKKSPQSFDAGEQVERTIPLSEKEFAELSTLPGKRLRKIRHYYPINGRVAEIDIFLDSLEGLGLVDFEFSSIDEKSGFKMPDFCLADVTQEEFAAGGYLAGKKYSDIEPFLKKYNYQKLQFKE
ncbi:MAG: hypothetical protein AUJ31_00175 [Parcubacteria group bacterium CG1_02_39_15]|uniref:CYTH domain-containing protein n=3 Tax=Candidatus Nealsoniibacteriota TaxID=1817911 RepID=A0A2G9YTE2_9BACT|nr:MAG: hypothetical protein AUJ31_00175 [Parcubacteria group bacterium CG1_02_39_15]PIP22524.1 MAG: hypothetical protein COX38_00055 [Candidatus Nealsonbacteria bacterium CG23_combo_of_CG06-09_8_20_14_all_39_25]PIQ98520.1 MAG: hypothetical protein COV64_00800 [Candidatus Nealsonbacteria bacterium CG11_big_fil_rev_8_21_14_0_20_39_9]PIW90554.1 MAG: hypothetical protein COZ92_00405 [Candidatus Nealsonbacteria bacterium CG_4_8_14_3_um_filter_40_11]